MKWAGKWKQKLQPSEKDRALLPVLTARYGIKAGITQDEMRTLIRNERRIELSFEEHRFWDIRRWKLQQQI